MTEHVNIDAPDNIDHFRNAFDLGSHGFFEHAHDHNLDGVETDQTTPHETRKDFKSEAVRVRPEIGRVWNVGQVTVTTSPAEIARSIDGQRSIAVRNDGAVDMFVGPNGGAATPWGGFRVPAGGVITIDINASVWASTSAGSTTAAVLIAALGSLS